MCLFYNISILLYNLGIRIASLFNSKAKLWIKGRKNIFQKLQLATQGHANIVWFHCASLGEFEQGRPIIKGYKKKYPTHKILLTFFSPSGYNIRKNDKIADWVFYLPADTKANAKRFIYIVKPIKVLFVKYEFWLNYIRECKKYNIPFYFVSSIFRKEQIFFKNKWFARQLKHVTRFFVQDKTSNELLKDIGINNSTISGDSRFDSVKEIKKNKKSFPLIEVFSKNKTTIICGSTWPKDEELIIKVIKENQQFNYIIAPHQLNNISELQKRTNGLLFSEANNQNLHNSNVLIIDSIGLLSSIYNYGEIAYIGGGFGSGIHNVLEAITFGLPVIFGPNYQKFNEANELIKLGTAKSIANFKQLRNAIFYFEKKSLQEICKNYIEKKSGATNHILQNI